jgi:hypothetical protein
LPLTSKKIVYLAKSTRFLPQFILFLIRNVRINGRIILHEEWTDSSANRRVTAKFVLEVVDNGDVPAVVPDVQEWRNRRY